jgi:hypothetical protein
MAMGSPIWRCLGSGNGTFTTLSNYTVGSSPVAAAVGDFNGDGKLDLAVS